MLPTGSDLSDRRLTLFYLHFTYHFFRVTLMLLIRAELSALVQEVNFSA